MFLIFLALSMLFSQASCTQTEPSEEENTQRLEMEDLPVTYSSAFEQKILAQCLSLFRRTRRLLKMEAPDPAQEAALSERIAADLLPTLEELPLYESEWEGILRAADTVCTAAETETWEGSQTSLFLQFYQSGLSAVSSQKLGAVLYHTAVLAIEAELEKPAQKPEEIAALQEQLTVLREELGAETFAQMTSMAVFFGSWMGGALTDGGDRLFAVSDAEAVWLLQKQGEYFDGLTITERQWEAAAELIGAWLQPKEGTDLFGRMLAAMQEDSTLSRMARVMPACLSLYRGLTQSLDAVYLDALCSNHTSARTSALISILAENEEGLRAFDTALALYAQEGEAVASVLIAEGYQDAYEDFLASTPSGSIEELLQALQACNGSYQKDKIEQLQVALVRYLRAYLPGLTFARTHAN